MNINFDRLLANHDRYFSLLEVLPFLAKVFESEKERDEFVELVKENIIKRLTDTDKEQRNE